MRLERMWKDEEEPLCWPRSADTGGCLLCLCLPDAHVLTITNSFMTQSEISANYGKVFANAAGSANSYISDMVNLKFIPDKVSLSQYITVLIKSPIIC